MPSSHQWIADLLEVLTHLQRLRQARGPLPVAELRVEATHLVAQRRRCTYSAIAKAYQRALGGDTDTFDRDVEDWLARHPAPLRDRILARAQTDTDRQRIDEFFRTPVTITDSDEQLPIPGLPTRKSGAPGRRAKPHRPTAVVLDPDVSRVFPDSEAVNTALRHLIQTARKAKPRTT